MGDIQRAAERADRSDTLDHAVRAGLLAYGLVYLVIAWLAIQLALGDREGSASTSGAVRELAQQPFGGVMVWLVALGMFLLVVWRLLEAAVGHRDEDGGARLGKRIGSVGKAVVYVVIGVSALRVATGSGSGSGGGGSDSFTAKILDLPFGQVLVGLVGAAVVGYGVALGVRAWTEGFREHLSAGGKSGDAGTAYVWFGKVGYAAKGVALALVGGLFCYAAITHDAAKSGGLDQALTEVLDQPFGPVLLGLVAVGIGCYGLFTFVRARHLSR